MTPTRKNPAPHPEDADSGSPNSGEPVFLAVGQLRRTHGVRGEMILEVLTDFPERLKRGDQVFLGNHHTPMRIRSIRSADAFLLIAFEGYDDRDQAGMLRNQVVYVRADKLPSLPEGEYYHHDLIGMQVIDESGAPQGTLVEILETGANDVYVVRSPEGAEILLPAIEDVILGVDLEKKQVTVRLPEWT